MISDISKSILSDDISVIAIMPTPAQSRHAATAPTCADTTTTTAFPAAATSRSACCDQCRRFLPPNWWSNDWRRRMRRGGSQARGSNHCRADRLQVRDEHDQKVPKWKVIRDFYFLLLIFEIRIYGNFNILFIEHYFDNDGSNRPEKLLNEKYIEIVIITLKYNNHWPGASHVCT